MKNKLNTILLVDDDAISNFVTEETLRQQAITQRLVTLTDAHEALDFLRRELQPLPLATPDVLVLLDLNMPMMDGFEFMEALQAAQLRQGVVVAILTSSDSQRDIAKAKQWDIAGFLQKPVSGPELSQLVERHFS
jgi:CheY-like chemotaxis protein